MSYTVISSRGTVDNDGSGDHQIVGAHQLIGAGVHSGSVRVSNFACVNAPLTASAPMIFSLGGVYVLSSSGVAAVVTASLPDPGSVPGARFIFRNGSAHAHAITGTLNGFKSFTKTPGITTSGVDGSKLALDSFQGSSVILDSDGLHFIVTATSGTVTLSQV